MERFFSERGAPVFHEVSPFAGVEAIGLLASRYQPVEISSVLCRGVQEPAELEDGRIRVRVIDANEAELWSRISAEGWTHEHPELSDFVMDMSNVCAVRKDSYSFLAEYDGVPGAAGGLCIHEGVALFAGAATIPGLRRRGLQSALLLERMRYAFQHGCDVAMMVAEIGSNSQRNAERQGFRIAYTRTKWKLRGVEMSLDPAG
jgi:hypothetical protein